MKLRATFSPRPPAPSPRTKAPIELGRTDPSASPAARNLALAYRLDALIENGLLSDYTAVARLLGVSQVRVTHLMSMLLLAPTIQDAILAGTLAPGDKDLRRLARIADWTELSAAALCRPQDRVDGHTAPVFRRAERPEQFGDRVPAGSGSLIGL